MTPKADLLILPAGPFQVPAIAEAQAMGLTVAAMDGKPNAPGLALADYSEPQNPMDPDRAIDVARRYNVRGVVAVASDPGLVPCAAVSNALGLSGLSPDQVGLVRNKLRVRERLSQRLPQYNPRFLEIRSTADLPRIDGVCGRPAILKPIDVSGSKGVVTISKDDDLEARYRYTLGYSRTGTVLAEEMLAGQEVSVEGVVFNGSVRIAAITDKTTTHGPFSVEIAHATPSCLPEDTQRAIRECVADITRELQLDNCCFHVEVFATADGPKLVEYGARLGGGCITSHLVPLATGINLTRAAIQIALGQPPDLARTRSQAAAIRFLTPAPGRVTAIEALSAARAIPGVVEVVCSAQTGSLIPPMENSDHRIGYTIATAQTPEAAAQLAESAASTIRIETISNP